MAPQPYSSTLPDKAEHQSSPPFADTSLQSNSSQTITDIVFGLCALFIGLVTFWQGRRAWIMWHVRDATPSQHADQPSANPTEVELGQRQVGSIEASESDHESFSSRTHDDELSTTPPAPLTAVIGVEEVRDTSLQANNSSSHEASESLKCDSGNEHTLCGENEEPGADTSIVGPTICAEHRELAADTSDVARTCHAESEDPSAEICKIARSAS
ncbi:MAG: hypothetical protein Q9191_008264 [Dirinaria sp. TL-2023a]